MTKPNPVISLVKLYHYICSRVKPPRGKAAAGLPPGCIGETPPVTRRGTFADLLAGHVQRKCHGYASLAYNAAWINRRTWSAIVTNPHRPVAKRTAIQFALALRLSRAEADELLRAAGYALSPSIIDDIIFASCFDDGVFNLFDVNQRLHDNGAKIIPLV